MLWFKNDSGQKEAEIAEANEENEIWEDHTTDDPNAIKLYPLAYIVVLSTLFGTIPGAILLALNFMKIKKYTSVIFVLLFGLIYPFVQYYLLGAISTLNDNEMHSRYSPETFIMTSGGLSLYIISALVMPKSFLTEPNHCCYQPYWHLQWHYLSILIRKIYFRIICYPR